MNSLFSSSHTKIIALSSLGGTLEMCDFTIYAFFARYISLNFFPHENHWMGLLNTFAIFLMGYCARPLGGILFGHFGDKYGRKNVFAMAAFCMALATLLMGCLPAYAQIGILAPILLLILRILQGMSVGGEVPGATVFTIEHVLFNRPGLAVGIIFGGLTVGNIISGSLGYFLTSMLTESQMLTWGWRIPFISGFFLGIVAYWLRLKAAETPIFLTMERNLRLYRVPAVKLIQSALPQLLLGVSLTGLSAMTLFFLLYLPSYPPLQTHFKPADLYLFNVLSFLSLAISTILFGFCSDYLGRRMLAFSGAFLTIIVGYLLFSNLIAQRDIPTLFSFGIIFSATVGMVNGCYPRMIAELFPAAIRYSGMAISYNLGFALFGGAMPLVMTLLFKFTQNDKTPFFLLLCGCVITLLGAISLKFDRVKVSYEGEHD